MIVAILRVHRHRSLERNRIIILVGLTREHHVVQIAIERIDTEIGAGHRRLLHRTEQQFGLANRHGRGIRCGIVTVRTAVRTD